MYNNLVSCNLKKGEYLFKKDEKANCLFIIKEGVLNCTDNEGRIIAVKKEGDVIGDRAILIDTLRTLNVIAATDSICVCITIENLKLVLGERFRDRLLLNFIKLSFQQSRYFNCLNPKLIEHIFHSFKIRNYGFGEVVLKSNYLVTQRIIVVIEGKLAKKSNTSIVIAEKGNILFEENIYKKVRQKTIEDIVAMPDCLLMHVNVIEFLNVLGGSFQDIILKSIIINTLHNVPLFKNMSQYKLEALSSAVEIKGFKKGEKIITEGEEGNQFFIIKSGNIDFYVKNDYIRTFETNECFGERALLLREPRSATAIAKTDVECFVLTKVKFLPFLEDNLKNYLIQRIYLQDNSIQLKDLNYIKTLGKGAFGEVSLVENKKNKQLYAIKGIQKIQIDYERLHENIEIERKIMQILDHQFIIKLVKTLKSDTHIFFLTEYIKGQELSEIMKTIGLFSKYQAQFYSASLFTIIDYIHNKNYIYRDIKPENIMVLENGYIKLLDFGTAKEIQDRTTTVIGTPEYMAPEIIKGEGYSFGVDYWSIGICLYEFMFGYFPFGNNEKDIMQVYMAISHE